ncbi:PREDICTED: sodium/potassium-transporting ATPase subunit beta-2-like isoform X2 [Nicrophorus vespilloides]|uniref:Sodium/potassium-transporting ATPase subunit beta-2-like isoform X2 n=1 Tax=Nicrophorus vespilloides TaxID=110193 RepID=A0ABM1NC42_NICVS|nr:PREDICTED: sodium/potassium-transporting ATPase subunit beta-2-like isoform X2 [Nicrophorus vespilloides]
MTASPKHQMSEKERYANFLYNKEDGTYLGRSKEGWAKICLFYLVFYGMLAALVAICMWVFFQTLDPRIPKWQMDSSIIGTNPGLGFRPMPTADNAESTLIWFEGSNKTNFNKWVNNLSAFLDKYYTPGKTEKGTASIRKCSYNQPPKRGQVCDFDVRLWGECSPDKFFNYHRNAPCIFLKLNRIYGWVPEYYNDIHDLPENMPDDLKKHIASVKPEERNTIWISCEGENPADIEYLGPISYHPQVQGFPGYYYPYENSEGYLSPLVAVQFLRPVSGIVINIECKAWAKNIKHSRADRTGSVHFELLID